MNFLKLKHQKWNKSMKKSNRIKQAFRARKTAVTMQKNKIKAHGYLFFAFLFLMLASYFLTKDYSIFNLF